MPIKTYISEDFTSFAFRVYIVQEIEGQPRRVMHFKGTSEDEVPMNFGNIWWDEVLPMGADVPPTLVLDGEAAMALLTALHEHFKGATDARQVREDLEYERKRSGEMLAVILRQTEATTHQIDAGR